MDPFTLSKTRMEFCFQGDWIQDCLKTYPLISRSATTARFYVLRRDIGFQTLLLCVFRLLRALGAPGDARTYWAGGEPIGGKEALKPLTSEFLHLHNKYDVDCPMNSNLSQNELR
ncbi:hypothetical protein Bca4012_068789 [Brassica carinata]